MVKMIIIDYILGNVLRIIEKRNWIFFFNIELSNVYVY